MRIVAALYFALCLTLFLLVLVGRGEGITRWYDLWCGLYVDRENRVLYVFPVPVFGVKVRL